MDNLQDLYIDLLQDLWSANSQCLSVTDELLEVAEDSELKSALQTSLDEIDKHNANLEEIIKDHGAKPRGEHCKGMEGLVNEARSHAVEAEFADAAVRDAMIIAQSQRLTHYGIAGYGTCLAMAKRLELNEDVETLRSDLRNVYQGDETMTSIAEGRINAEAMAEV